MERVLRSTTSASRLQVARSSFSSSPKAQAPKTPPKTLSARPDRDTRAKSKRHGGTRPQILPRKKVRLQTPDSSPHKTNEGSGHNSGAAGEIVSLSDRSGRPAEPHRTNAPLLTPKGSRVVMYTKHTAEASPSKTGLPRPITTTGHILEDACAHLIQTDPRLKPVIDQHYCHPFCPDGLAEECDPFKTLCSSIMAQQVSGAAASSIKRKFIGLFHPSLDEGQATEDRIFPSPVQVADCTVPFLRQAGLSERKAEYIKGLAEKFSSGELSASMLINASDEELMDKLTAVRGLGRWSVEMFACFGLKRMDILSTGDLGVQYVF